MTLSKNIEQTDDEIVVIRCFSKVRFPNDFFGNTIDQIVSYFTPNSFTESVNIFACVISEYCHGLHKFLFLDISVFHMNIFLFLFAILFVENGKSGDLTFQNS